MRTDHHPSPLLIAAMVATAIGIPSLVLWWLL
jgi:hypothetical protein